MKFNFTLKTDDDCFVHLESIVEVKVGFKLSCNRVFYHIPVAYFPRVQLFFDLLFQGLNDRKLRGKERIWWSRYLAVTYTEISYLT